MAAAGSAGCATRWWAVRWRACTPEPAHPWTVEELAREAAASRSVLTDRFTHFVGHPPMLYLMRWRMQLAAGRLSDGSAKVAAVARDVGYESEAAFSRAFKKLTGVGPALWRSRHHEAGERDRTVP